MTCYRFLPIHLLLSCRYAETWLAWVTMERSLRQIPAARSLFKRCFNRKMEADGQLSVAMQWLRFEREEGRWGPAAQGHAVLLGCMAFSSCRDSSHHHVLIVVSAGLLSCCLLRCAL